MFSLRKFHLLFILIAIVFTDMFGAWAVWDHAQSHDRMTLVWGIVSFALGFALIGYGIWVVRKFNAAHLE